MSATSVSVDTTLDGHGRWVNWSAANLPLTTGGGISDGAVISVNASVADRLLEGALRGRSFRLQAYAARAPLDDVSAPVLVAWFP